MASSTKAHKNRLRRMAERQGFVLQLSRRRDPRAIDFEEWWLVDARLNGIVRSGFGLDTLEHWLEEGEWLEEDEEDEEGQEEGEPDD